MQGLLVTWVRLSLDLGDGAGAAPAGSLPTITVTSLQEPGRRVGVGHLRERFEPEVHTRCR